jgi:hypothetical protein
MAFRILVCLGFCLGLTATAWAEAGKGEPPKAPPTVNGVRPLSHYDDVVTKNPFSPRMYVRPKPVKKPVKKPIVQGKKVLKKVDNLTLTGVVLDHRAGCYVAMLEVKGKKTLYLPPGKGFNKIKITAVRFNAVDITDHKGKKRTILLGKSFHDGVATRTEWVGGPGPASSSSSSSTASSPSTPPAKKSSLSEAKRREILERLKARRNKLRNKK